MRTSIQSFDMTELSSVSGALLQFMQDVFIDMNFVRRQTLQLTYTTNNGSQDFHLPVPFGCQVNSAHCAWDGDLSANIESLTVYKNDGSTAMLIVPMNAVAGNSASNEIIISEQDLNNFSTDDVIKLNTDGTGGAVTVVVHVALEIVQTLGEV